MSLPTASSSSHLIGCIKPDREAFEHVLQTLDVQANNVYFFDDAALNVIAARTVGMNSYHAVGFEAVKTTLNELGFCD